MPSRIIKESITTSESLSEVSADAERLFWRLVVKADDKRGRNSRAREEPRHVLSDAATDFARHRADRADAGKRPDAAAE